MVFGHCLQLSPLLSGKHNGSSFFVKQVINAPHTNHDCFFVFSSFPGFSRLRMHNKGGSPVAFVEYQVKSPLTFCKFTVCEICLWLFQKWQLLLQDVLHANEALTRLQGFVLFSSERGGMRIEFAKNKMGEVCRSIRFGSPFLSWVSCSFSDSLAEIATADSSRICCFKLGWRPPCFKSAWNAVNGTTLFDNVWLALQGGRREDSSASGLSPPPVVGLAFQWCASLLDGFPSSFGSQQ